MRFARDQNASRDDRENPRRARICRALFGVFADGSNELGSWGPLTGRHVRRVAATTTSVVARAVFSTRSMTRRDRIARVRKRTWSTRSVARTTRCDVVGLFSRPAKTRETARCRRGGLRRYRDLIRFPSRVTITRGDRRVKSFFFSHFRRTKAHYSLYRAPLQYSTGNNDAVGV